MIGIASHNFTFAGDMYAYVNTVVAVRSSVGHGEGGCRRRCYKINR